MPEYQKLVERHTQNHERIDANKKRLLKELAKKQDPKVMLITCADSRIEMGWITDSQPGEIFTIRHIANWVPPYTTPDDHKPGDSFCIASSIEYAVKFLGVAHIVVMGHQNCGGIAALIGKDDQKQLLCCQKWLSMIDAVRNIIEQEHTDLSLFEKQKKAELLVVKASLKNLETYPFVTKAMSEKKLCLHGWHYHTESGSLYQVDPQTLETSKLS